MRKRAQQRFKPVIEEPRHITQQYKPRFEEKKPSSLKKNWWLVIALVSIFFLVLFFNSYYNITSGIAINPDAEGLPKYYLAGPDPYYNMRLVEETYKTGIYPYYNQPDPLLAYPVGTSGGRAPLFNMMAMGFSRLLTPFMNEIDAIGYSMQFIPALFGALLIFPVFFIGKELFNKKAGIIAAMLIAIIPIHLGSGHGSAYSLFDHDSFNLLLFFLTFYFLIKSIKEKNASKSMMYAILGGVPLAGLTMTWVEAQYLYAIIGIYAFVQMFFDIFTNRIEIRVFRSTSIILFSGYLISLPVIASRGGIGLSTSLFLCIAVTAFGFAYYIFGRRKVPWTLSIPVIAVFGAFGFGLLYFIKPLSSSIPFLTPLQRLSEVIFGSGIYGNKVSMTIAEANTYIISQTVMSFGPALYWLAWFGFILLAFYYYKNNQRRDYLFICMLFIVNIWLAGTAGRFLNDTVPLIAILGGWIIWRLVQWLDYKQMIRNIRSAGGGIHGLRRGFNFLHLFGILFVFFLVLIPNVYVAFDAAIPNTIKEKEDGTYTSLKAYMYGDDNHQGAYGLSLYKERYWGDAFDWLSQQDTEIEDPTQRPGFISWWDYGFYEVALGGHPTVADNFQDGIPTAANFHTAVSEREAIVVLSICLLEGDRAVSDGDLSPEVMTVLENRVGSDSAIKIRNWMITPNSAPSYGEIIDEDYPDYFVGQQYERNAVYQDIVALLINDEIDPVTNETIGLSDDEITWLYHDLQEATGFSVRYYGVEGYDKDIFKIFGFLSDKSIILVNGLSDDFMEIWYSGYKVNSRGEKILGSEFTKPASEIVDLPIEERRYMVFESVDQRYKEDYFETMFYKTYIGPADTKSDGTLGENPYQFPCLDMKHFYAEFMSDLSEYQYYGSGRACVVIAKYYEGAYVNGTVTFEGDPVDAQVVVQKNVTYYGDFTVPIDHDKADTDDSGNFNVIVGAGDVFLSIRKDLGLVQYPLRNVTFNDLNDPNLRPITDADAMRLDGSNYERFINITLEPARIGGYVYNDTDFDDSFNESNDEPLSGLDVTLYEITSFYEDADGSQKVALGMAIPLETDENGYYSNSDELPPGVYRMVINRGDFLVHFNDVYLNEGNNTYDASHAKPANVEGVVYYDSDRNSVYDSGEEMQGVTVELILNNNIVRTATTDSAGKYSFKSVVPGVINGADLNEYTLRTWKGDEYDSSITIFPEENVTTYQNVSIGLTPITVTGLTLYDGDAKTGILVDFTPDATVENNTAVGGNVESLDDGSFEIDLQPGSYNVTVEHKVNNSVVYTFDENLELALGQAPLTWNIAMNKESATVSGTVTYGTVDLDGVLITFKGIDTPVLNRIVTATAENGYYTVELNPGTYNISISHNFVQADNNYRYTYEATYEVTTAPSVETYNIEVERAEIEE